ncbi:NHL repeat-containing protein [Nocardioides carbamazepini]|uniref:NHL repeat-containing protein n=1 Tax=Nocardioides carbamazepini TaxID=2854259 RepID=UPI00214A61DE|nr:NHL repeat-containing protein [Nocardioides carbamazepini]MCR1785020.1 NHL repeat-containing protein [Nocardioides carbamazepini]
MMVRSLSVGVSATHSRGRPSRRLATLAAALGAAAALVVGSLAAAPPATAGPAGYVLAATWDAVADDDVATAPDGTVWSVDGYSTVNHFSSTGVLLGAFTPAGLAHVAGIAVGPDGTLYLTDSDVGSPSVVAYTAAGSPTGRSYTLSDEAVALGVAIAPTGEVLVTNASTDRVEVFSATGTWLRNIGSSGAGPGQLDRPDDVVVGADGTVFVSDYWNHRVQRFNLATGAYLGGFGQLGRNPGQLDTPYAVDLTPAGNVVVFDEYAISEFTPTGALVSRTDHGLTLLHDYQGMSIDAAGAVYTTRLSGLARFVPAGGTASGTAKVTAPKKGVKVVKKKVRLTVACVSATPCSGTLTLTVKGKQIAKPKAYAVAAGGKAKVKVKLTKKGLKVVSKKAVTKAVASVTGGAKKVRIRR